MLILFLFQSRNRKKKAKEIYTKLVENQYPGFDPTLAYIQFMKFMRRSEGIKAARLAFKKAREDVRSNHHVFTAAALMEYYCSKVKQVKLFCLI